MRLVIIDDQMEFMHWAITLFERRGHQCYLVDSLESAIHSLGYDLIGIDAIITDYMMPGMRGDQVKIACDERWPSLPVFI